MTLNVYYKIEDVCTQHNIVLLNRCDRFIELNGANYGDVFNRLEMVICGIYVVIMWDGGGAVKWGSTTVSHCTVSCIK